jgi:hypothetical protein
MQEKLKIWFEVHGQGYNIPLVDIEDHEDLESLYGENVPALVDHQTGVIKMRWFFDDEIMNSLLSQNLIF